MGDLLYLPRMTSTTTTAPTIFIYGSHWMISEPTASGFKHTRLGTTIKLHSRDLAEQVAEEYLAGKS